MSKPPTIELSWLREIGWSTWNSIGLEEIAPDWRDAAPDEYDSYLLHVVSLLRKGRSDVECVDYLVRIEAEHMGMGTSPTSRSRASETVASIRRYLDEFPDGPLRVR